MAQVALTKGCLIGGSMDLLCDFYKNHPHRSQFAGDES
jgi:hypothetical protein